MLKKNQPCRGIISITAIFQRGRKIYPSLPLDWASQRKLHCQVKDNLMDALSDVMDTRPDIVDLAKENYHNAPNKIISQIDHIKRRLSQAATITHSVEIRFA